MNRWKTKPTNNRQTNKQKLKKSAVPLRVLNFQNNRADDIGMNIESESFMSVSCTIFVIADGYLNFF